MDSVSLEVESPLLKVLKPDKRSTEMNWVALLHGIFGNSFSQNWSSVDQLNKTSWT